MKVCKIDDCQGKHNSLGFCVKHYARFKKYGDPSLTKKGGVGISRPWDRFIENVDATPGFGDSGDCWKWTGTKTIYGYGQILINRQLWRAHRLSYYLHYGFEPMEVVMHECDNKLCVNPDHLRAGTFLENTKQAHERGLYAIGERQGSAKLTNNEVRDIKRLLADGHKDAELGRLFGVTAACISGIRNEYNWKHIVLDPILPNSNAIPVK